jgi:hypothetical protein
VEKQHPEAFAEYDVLCNEKKKSYFEQRVSRNNTLHAHFDGENAYVFSVSKDIVDVIIGDMLFDPDDDASTSTREKALSVFVVHQDPNRKDYQVKIRSARCFDLVVGFVAAGVSFRMASRLATHTQDVSKMGCFKRCSEGHCATFTRVVCAVNLQKLSSLLSQCWGFSLALDVGTKQGTSYIDVRLRFSVDDDMHNFHMLALPMFERKTASIIFNTIVKALSALEPRWNTKLLSVSTDGERTMTGRVSGVATLFQKVRCTSFYASMQCYSTRLHHRNIFRLRHIGSFVYGAAFISLTSSYRLSISSYATITLFRC